ncbi:RNA-guided endonuclease InsQ/TnpB family protein [Haloprofundus halophilus]|uniref:RNA-guided endonuclease InsQ/TnpB family protein n=1 Tax=Haloprofundus halophilus TaxID=2283527 RepID=UPI0018E57120|nr:RNA-guided endonuclease TnpB family protein [Haloprofundus halophilus]
MDDYLRRTAITRIIVSDEQADLLEATISDWQHGATHASQIGWRKNEDSKYGLQQLAYDDVREETRLGSQHAILATHQAASALTGVNELKDKGRNVSCPEFTSPTIKYDANTLTLFDDNTVSLSTVESRVRCELVLPEDDDGYQYQFLNDDEWSVTESTLTARDGEYFLHLGFRKPNPFDETGSPAEDRTVLGVDLGIENLAVTSTAHFASGKKLVHDHDQFEQVRGGLQQTGTQSAHRTIVGRDDREERYSRDKLHRVSNAIIEEAVEHECSHIVFEDLSYIRDRMANAKRFHQWAHRKLIQFVTYKAEALGIRIEFVDAAYTSQRCSECGHTSRGNRPVQAHFECEKCEKTLHADYNAAKNIGWRFVRRGLNDSRRTGNSQLALKSGTVTPKRGFIPYSVVS